MNNKKKSKNLLILVILLAIIGIAVGYAALSQTLVLNGKATLAGSSEWNVHFKQDSEAVASKSGGVTGETIELDSGLLVGTFEATLEPGAEVVYNVSVVNDGTIEAKLDGEPVIEGETEHIKCSVTPTSQATTLSSTNGNEHDYVVTLTCTDMEELPDAEEIANIKVKFNYVQAN